MRIVKNTSGYDTRALRALIVLAHRHIKKHEARNAPMWRLLEIVVRGRDLRQHTSGCAYLGGAKMWLTLPRPTVSAREVLFLAYHELMHSFGYEHRQFRDLRADELAALVPNDRALPLERAKPKRDAQASRIASLMARKRQWETKAKRAETALKKINRSLAYYNRRRRAAHDSHTTAEERANG